MQRIILHCDLNSFYASVECLYRPEIRALPVVVCGNIEKRHGIILAKNEVAKKYKIQTGEPLWQAKQKCPSLVAIEPSMGKYMKFSKAAREIYLRYTGRVEAFGVDECWLDVTDSTRLFGSGEKLAYTIKDTIQQELGITASVGVADNKIFAKLGSDMKKPNAVTVITPENYKQKVWTLPATDLLYVGRSTGQKLRKIGLHTIGQLACAEKHVLRGLLGKWGETLWTFANGEDVSPVLTLNHEVHVKSIGNSMTTACDLKNIEDVKIVFYVLAESVAERLRHATLVGKTVQITIRGTDLCLIERQGKLTCPTSLASDIASKALEIFKGQWAWHNDVRALGVRVTDLMAETDHGQLCFLQEEAQRARRQVLEHTMDAVRGRYGHYAIQRALHLAKPILKANPIDEHVVYPVSFFR
ncbi:MAG: DNA polymerase IV [Hyphomonadaceae bacterium]|nr:DNA polymerase IV [Clostridia bacterium]